MMYLKNKKGLIEPESDYPYKTILALREKEKAESRFNSLLDEITKIKRTIGIE